MNINRREFLKLGPLAWGAMGINMMAPSLFQRRLLAAELPSDRKLIFIFQNGGNDGINTMIPTGDPQYNNDTRPTLYIPPNQAIDTGNGFAHLHPALQPMMEIYNKTSLNGQAGPGNLAVLHRIGYSGQSQSHFDSQQYWQNGVPGKAYLEEGMFYRHLTQTLDLNDPDNAFVAAAISSSQMVALKGNYPFPNFSRATDFSFGSNQAKSRKFLGALPALEGGPGGTGIFGLYGGTKDDPSKVYRPLVHNTGQQLGRTMNTLQSAVALGTYAPANGAVYSNDGSGDAFQTHAGEDRGHDDRRLGHAHRPGAGHGQPGEPAGAARAGISGVVPGFAGSVGQGVDRDDDGIRPHLDGKRQHGD
jgi:hypothetical protein